jgi:uncharacterized membrane protein
MTTLADPRPYRLPAVLLGIGLGGFFDGIVFHQVLQWHHYVSSRVPADSQQALETNLFVDGLFHSATWLVTVVGVVLLWRAAQLAPLPSARYAIGGVLLGWGAINLADGIVNHHLLGLHHVKEGAEQLFWDIAVLVWGAAFAVIGWWLMRGAPARVATGRGRASGG